MNGDTFTAIESILLDEYGHVTQIISKTYKVAVGGIELFIVTDPTSMTIAEGESKDITVITKPGATITTTGASGICSASVTESDLVNGVHKITCLGYVNMKNGSSPMTITTREGVVTKTSIVTITGAPTDPLTITSLTPTMITGTAANKIGGVVAVTFNRTPTGHTVSPYTNSNLYYIDETSLSGNILYVYVKFQPTPTNGSATVTVTGTLGYQTASGTFTVFYDSLIEP